MDKETIYGKVKVAVKNGEYAVTDLDDNVIVPFGKYDWIEGFDFGLSRVRTKGIHNHPECWVPCNCKTQKEYDEQMAEIKEEGRKYEEDRRLHNEKYSKWGIINEEGEEVLPVEYDEVWGFMGRGYASTNVEKDGITRKVYFDVRHNRPTQITQRSGYVRDYYDDDYESDSYDDYGSNYGEYAGSYAQDVEGYSDDVIGDAFDGDPEAYWNID